LETIAETVWSMAFAILNSTSLYESGK
jgi:hypothetical protein